MEKLAIFGGKATKTTAYGKGNRFGKEELEQVKEALEQQTLFYWYGKKVKAMTEKFANMCGVDYCVATSSGTAAIHVALGTLGVTAGDEVIVPPITDMGSIIGILFQNAVPVFADLDPYNFNLDPKSVESKITDKTKAIIVVHLAGNAADMDPIMEIAHKHNIKVIEDCAQSYMTYYKGRLAGTIGDIGCFSLNDFKTISAGDGGMCIMNNKDYYLKALRFADKNYNRLPDKSHASRDVDFLAPNYRMTELQGAVALAQLGKLPWICEKRNAFGDGITKGISGIPGIFPPKIIEGGKSSYWFYLFRIDEKFLHVTRSEFCKALAEEGISCDEGYIPSCVYDYGMFKDKTAYQNTHCPFDCKYYGKNIDYKEGLCPTAEDIIRTSVRLPVSEFFTEQDMKDVISGIRKVAEYYANSK